MYFFLFKRIKSIPEDIKIMTYATTIRWIGWGFVEGLIPIFLLGFANSYAETGLLKSSYDLAYIISVPIIGALVDKISARTIILIGLCIYPFVGLTYYLAGAFSLVSFLIIARVLNGVGYAMDSVGREVYMRRHVEKDKISTAFGYFDSITTFWWIISVLISIVLVKYFKIHVIFLAIIPTTLYAIYLISKLNHHNPTVFKDGFKNILKENIIKTIVAEIKSWSGKMRLMAFILFCMGFISVIIGFILPLSVYSESGSITKVILVEVFTALPYLLSWKIGKIADKNRIRTMILGLLSIVVLIFLFSQTSSYALQLMIGFCLGTALSMVLLSASGITTDMVEIGHYGRMSSLTDGIDTIGALVAPVVLGFSIDAIGFNSTLRFISLAILAVFAIVLFKAKKLNTVLVKIK